MTAIPVFAKPFGIMAPLPTAIWSAWIKENDLKMAVMKQRLDELGGSTKTWAIAGTLLLAVVGLAIRFL